MSADRSASIESAEPRTLPSLGELFALASPYRLRIALALLGLILEAACAAIFVRLIEPMLDEVFGARNPSVIATLPWIILGLFLLRGVGVFLGDFNAAWIARRVNFDLRQQSFRKFLSLPSTFFSKAPSGELLAQMTSYIEEVGRTVTEGFKTLLLDGLMLLALLSVMFYQSWQLTLYVFLVGPLIGLVVSVVGRRYRRVSKRIQSSLADVNSVVGQVISGHKEIRVYGAQQQESERFATINEQNFKQNLKIIATNGLSTSTVQFLAAVALALVVYLASHGHTDKNMTPGEFMSFISAMIACLPSLKKLTSVQSAFARGVTALGAVRAVLHAEDECDQGKHQSERVHGAITFEGVTLRYPGSERPAIENLSLQIAPGQTIALVGRSGGGKSSLAAMIPRFFDPQEGRVLIDGIDARDYTLANLRQQLALVSQHVVLFDDSAEMNIAFGDNRKRDRAAIETAAKAAQAHEFISQMPAGYQSRLGENGNRLSGGQRQRMAIARALLKDAPILILDEATSALDNESERLIQDAFDSLRKGRTTIVIAHRLSTVERADAIYVLERGKLVEQGRHQDLLAQGGLYAQLYRQDQLGS
jgi:subfamily B ATP-binding cassette protein MsbA